MQTLCLKSASELEKETDGDGSWDGWIGVYGVEDSSDLILYMENIQSGGGIKGDERVDAQAGVHRATVAPSATTTPLAGRDGEYHSNVHIGELHWRTDPSERSETPNPKLRVEVDYLNGTDPATREALDRAERTYALYGMTVEYTVDDAIDRSELDGIVEHAPPTSFEDATYIEEAYHDTPDTVYLFISTNGDANPDPVPDWDGGPEGVASTDGKPAGLGFGMLIFTKDHGGSDDGPELIHFTKTIVHETGHILGAGRADDQADFYVIPDEVYSGDGRDNTTEFVELGDGNEYARWSVMGSGWQDGMNIRPMSGDYMAFSIEELSTVEFRNIELING